MKYTIKLVGKEEDIKQSLAELQSNILYDNLNVKIKEVKEK